MDEGKGRGEGCVKKSCGKEGINLIAHQKLISITIRGDFKVLSKLLFLAEVLTSEKRR